MKNFLYSIAVLIAPTVCNAEDFSLVPDPSFTITILFPKMDQKVSFACKTSATCKSDGKITIRGQQQNLNIALNINPHKHHSRARHVSPYAPKSFRYNLTIDTGKPGTFLNTAHLAKRGTLPPYEGVYFQKPLTYWYKKGGREHKINIDLVQIQIEPNT